MKIKCVKTASDTVFVKGKVYEAKDGKVTIETGTCSLPLVESNPFRLTVSGAEFEKVKEITKSELVDALAEACAKLIKDDGGILKFGIIGGIITAEAIEILFKEE